MVKVDIYIARNRQISKCNWIVNAFLSKRHHIIFPSSQENSLLTINPLKVLEKLVNERRYTFPVHTQRCFNVYTTSITLGRRRINVKMTLCAYWVLGRLYINIKIVWQRQLYSGLWHLKDLMKIQYGHWTL